MKASELRIGNLTEYFIIDKLDERKEFWEVNALDIDDISDINRLGYKLAGYRPIPLTEEWLLRFGFERIKINTSVKGIWIIYYKLNDFVVYLLSDFFEVELIKKNKEQFNLRKVFKKEVHILQNLYFAIINQELTLKP
jgi:hypothetical protein